MSHSVFQAGKFQSSGGANRWEFSLIVDKRIKVHFNDLLQSVTSDVNIFRIDNALTRRLASQPPERGRTEIWPGCHNSVKQASAGTKASLQDASSAFGMQEIFY